MSTYKLAANGVTLPLTIMPAGRSGSMDLAEQERPRADGSIVQVGRQKSRVYRLVGAISAATPDLLDTAVRQVRAAMDGQSTALEMYLGRDDRFYLAQCESWSDDYTDGLLYGVHVACSMQIKVADVWGFAAAPTTTAITVGASTTVTNAGDAPSKPSGWQLTIGTAGTGVITLSNSTTGETMTISGTFAAGDVIVLDRVTYAVTWNGAAAFGLVDGRIPRLVAGANVIPPMTITGGISVSAAQVVYTARYQ